jgi:hypothetical protein
VARSDRLERLLESLCWNSMFSTIYGRTDLSGTSRANGFYYFHVIIPLHTNTAVTHFTLKSTNAVQERVNRVLQVQRNIWSARSGQNRIFRISLQIDSRKTPVRNRLDRERRCRMRSLSRTSSVRGIGVERKGGWKCSTWMFCSGKTTDWLSSSGSSTAIFSGT